MRKQLKKLGQSNLTVRPYDVGRLNRKAEITKINKRKKSISNKHQRFIMIGIKGN